MLTCVALVMPSLTPDGAVRLALERSGKRTAAELEAQMRALERGLDLDPVELRLGHRALEGWLGEPIIDDGQTYEPLDEAYVAVRWSLPRPADIADAWAERERREADALDLVELEREIEAAVRVLHARVLSLRAEEELARKVLDNDSALEEQTRARASAEMGTSLDSRLVALQRLDAAGDVEQITSERRRAEHALAALIGSSPPLALEPGQELCSAPHASLDELVLRAEAGSPALRALQSRRDEASRRASLSWVPWLPWVDGVLVGWYNEPLDKRDSMRARLDIALPLFEPFSGKADVAGLEARRFDALLGEGRRALAADVRSALERLDSALTLVRLLEEGQTSVVDQSLSDAARALEAGQADLVRLSEVQGRALRSRRGLVRARLRCEEAAIDLLRVTGPAHVEQH